MGGVVPLFASLSFSDLRSSARTFSQSIVFHASPLSEVDLPHHPSMCVLVAQLVPRASHAREVFLARLPPRNWDPMLSAHPAPVRRQPATKPQSFLASPQFWSMIIFPWCLWSQAYPGSIQKMWRLWNMIRFPMICSHHIHITIRGSSAASNIVISLMRPLKS